MRISMLVPNNRCLLARVWLTATLLACHAASAANSDGWFEVTRGSKVAWDRPVTQESAQDVARDISPDTAQVRTLVKHRTDNHDALQPAIVKGRYAEVNPGIGVDDGGNLPDETGHGSGTVNVDMFVGQVKIFGPVEVSRVANGNGSIVRAEVLDSGELMVIAQSEGSSSVRLWHKDGRQSDYNIRVSSSDPETRVRRETMVRMRVRMVEFRKSALGKLGIDWSDSMGGPGLAVAADAVGNPYFRPEAESVFSTLPNTVQPMSAYFGIAANITSRINFLASTGDAKTLAEPVLSTMNGGTASFLAGGEVPYPTVGSDGRTIIQFKEYGVKLNVSPRIDSSGLVRTIIDTEISQLDPAVSVMGTPGLLTRKAQTEVNVRSGETIVISGLLSSESGKDIDKIPGIARLPVIGRLFRTQNARNTVSELVVFVTPEVIEPQQPMLSNRESRFLSTSNRLAEDERQKIPLME